jgi:hypothetical protein
MDLKTSRLRQTHRLSVLVLLVKTSARGVPHRVAVAVARWDSHYEFLNVGRGDPSTGDLIRSKKKGPTT